MRRALLVSLLAFVTITTTAASPQPFELTQPFERVYHDERFVMCTAWPTVTPQGRFWVTAAHCLVEDHEVYTGEIWIGGKEAKLVKLDGEKDLALLSGGPKSDVLSVAGSNPKILTPLLGVGFPFGTHFRHVVTGTFIGADDLGLNAYNLPTAGGMSGGPILDAKSGMVVGVMQETECQSMFPTWCPVSRGAPVENLRAFLGLDAD